MSDDFFHEDNGEPIVMGIPTVIWDYLGMLMGNNNVDRTMVVGLNDGNFVGIDMGNFILIPAYDRLDSLISSGSLTDLLVQSNEEAFRAGFEAALAHVPEASRPKALCYDSAWSNYTPSDAILELQDNLSGEDE